MQGKRYKNYLIAPRPDSIWWNVLKDNEFIAMVIGEENAREFVAHDLGENVSLNESMMSPVDLEIKLTNGYVLS